MPQSRSAFASILGSATLIAALTAVVKLGVLGRDIIAAQRFGTGEAMDVFSMAMVLPVFAVGILGGSFGSAVIPAYLRTTTRLGRDAGQALLGGISLLGGAALLTASVLLAVCAPLYVPLLAGGFDAAKTAAVVRAVQVLAPWTFLNGLVMLAASILNAQQRFAAAALSPITTPTATIMLLLLYPQWGVMCLVGGQVAGAASEILVLLVVLRRRGLSLRPRLTFPRAPLVDAITQYAPALGGAVLMSSTLVVDNAMAAHLPAGSVATLNYANRLILLPMGLTAMALGNAAIPYLAQLVAEDKTPEAFTVVRTTVRRIFLVAIPAVGLLILVAEPAITIVFQRGAFAVDDAQAVARVFSLAALQLPFYIASIMLIRLIAALRRNTLVARAALYNLALNIILNAVFMRIFGVAGIALSTSCVYAFSFCYVALALRRIARSTPPEAAS